MLEIENSPAIDFPFKSSVGSRSSYDTVSRCQHFNESHASPQRSQPLTARTIGQDTIMANNNFSMG